MNETFYRTGQAAKQLGISSYRIRQLCEAGVIAGAECSEVGQWLIPASEVAKLVQNGIPPIPRKETAVSGHGEASQARRNRNQNQLIAAPSEDAVTAAENSFISERQLVADNHKLARLKVRKEGLELQDWFDARDDARFQRELERQQREADAAELQRQELQAQFDRERRDEFSLKWIGVALTTCKPLDAPPDYGVLVHDDLRATLDRLPLGTPNFMVEALVKDSIARSLRPSRAVEERTHAQATAVKRALSDLPVQMGWDDEWKGKAHKAALDAVDAAREDAPVSDLVAMAKLAVSPLVKQYKHGEKISSAVNSTYLIGGSSADQRDARKAVEAALAELPCGADERDFDEAKEKALGPARERIQARQQQQEEDAERQRQQQLEETKQSNLAAAKQRLIDDGTREVYWHAILMLREFNYEKAETASAIEARCKSEVEKTLRQELTGNEGYDAVKQRVHELMEEIEGCD